MELEAKSIRPFIGSKNFETSRGFYRDLGFEETILSHNLSLFKMQQLGFYLQDAFVEDWINNTMIFMEVANVHHFFKALEDLRLPSKYEQVRLTAPKKFPWGEECYLHDPCGNLWHFGEFATQ